MPLRRAKPLATGEEEVLRRSSAQVQSSPVVPDGMRVVVFMMRSGLEKSVVSGAQQGRVRKRARNTPWTMSSDAGMRSG